MTKIDSDIVIVGGGLVGMALAAACRDLPFTVTLLERRAAAPAVTANEHFDERSLALSRVSVAILSELGVWPQLAAAAAPICHVHISEQYRFGVTRLHAADCDVEAFGQVTGLRSIGVTLQRQLGGQSNLQRYDDALCLDFSPHADQVEVSATLSGAPCTLRCRLLLIADGSDSGLRDVSGLQSHTNQYDQQALVANVEADGIPEGWAFERFTPEGPLAFLPLPGARYAVVWTGTPALTLSRLALSDTEFLAALQAAVGSRVGRLLRVGRRESFPLRQIRTERMAGQRYALLGNAAHTLHPVAGQGLNLALRDVAVLRNLLSTAVDPGAAGLLASYNESRLQDVTSTARSTDLLVRAFDIPGMIPSHLRSLALFGLDCLPVVKRRIARYGMGIRADLASHYL